MQYHQHCICTITSAATTSTWVAESSVFAGHTGTRSETRKWLEHCQQLPTGSCSPHFPLIYLLFQMPACGLPTPTEDTEIPVSQWLLCCLLHCQLNLLKQTPGGIPLTHLPILVVGATSEWLAPYHVILK